MMINSIVKVDHSVVAMVVQEPLNQNILFMEFVW